MTIRFTKSWNGYYEGQIVSNPAGGNTEAQLIALGYAVSDLDGPDNSFELAKFATDSSGNVTGLVGPGGGTVSLRSGQHQCILVGDSLTAQDIPSPSGSYIQRLGNALFQHINYRLGGRLSVAAISGVSGTRSDQILTALQTTLAANTGIGYAFISCGANDVNQYLTYPVTEAQYKANMRNIIAACLSYGVRPILYGIPGSATYITTAGKADMWISCNSALKDLAREYPDVVLLQLDTVMSDVAAAYPANLATLCDGSFHPNSLACKLFADYAYTTLNAIIPPVDLFHSHNHVGGANELLLTANPLMTGTSALTGGTTPTGNVASGGLVTVAGTGVGVGSVVANSNGPTGCQWSQVAYTGPASAVNATDYVQALGTAAAVSLATAGLAVGDTIQGLFEFNVTGTIANFMGAEIFLNFVGATGSVTPPLAVAGTYSRSYGMKQNNSAAPLVALGSVGYGAGVLETLPMPIPSGTTAIQMFVRAYPVSGSSGATFTVQFGRNRVRKVIA